MKRYLSSRVHCRAIHNGQKKVEATQVPVNGRLEKPNGVYAYKGMLVTLLKKKAMTHATAWMNIEDLVLG